MIRGTTGLAIFALAIGLCTHPAVSSAQAQITDMDILDSGLGCSSTATTRHHRRINGRFVPSTLPIGVYEVAGTDPDLPTDDLAPLGQIIGSSTVVALGETVHGSGGFSEAKDRVFRYLVQEHGFRIFAFESPWPGAELVADHVAAGQGTAEDAISGGLFSVWQCQEVVTLVQWMRSWNLDFPDDPVAFFGFDVQQPEEDGAGLIDFLEVVADDATEMVAGLSACAGVDGPTWPVNADDHQLCLAALDQVQAFFDDSYDEIVAASSEEELEWAWIRLISLQAWQGLVWGYSTGDVEAAFVARDAGMAELFVRIRGLRHPEAKTVIWAHNWHIATNTHQWQHNADMGAAPSMGTLLAEELGDAYTTIALNAGTTEFWWPWIDATAQIFTAENGVEYQLHALGHDGLLVDTNTTTLFEAGEAVSWWWPHYTMNMQWYWWEIESVPAHNFDAVLFLDHVRAMDPLPSAMP